MMNSFFGIIVVCLLHASPALVLNKVTGVTSVRSFYSVSKRVVSHKSFAPLYSSESETDVVNETQEDEKSVQRKEISDAMKRRLQAELRSQGADPNYSAGPILGNPILLISLVISVLVILGGKGYFY